MRKRLLEMLLTLKECPINLSNPKVLSNYEAMLGELGFPESEIPRLEQKLFASCRFFPTPSDVREAAAETCPKRVSAVKLVSYFDSEGTRTMMPLEKVPGGSVEVDGRYFHPDSREPEEKPQKVIFKAQKEHGEKSIEDQIRELNAIKRVSL